VVGSRGAAAHRQEDKNREALTAGVSRQNLLLPEDLERGGGAAFVILKRGGENVMDLVNLDKLLAKEKVRDEAQKLAA
jgi:hypothetical protein